MRLKDHRKDYFYFRKQCYDLISKIILAVDNLASNDPQVVDGQLTIVAKRKNEAYGVIADSTDEVFLTSLYDWYLEQGWSDRLLQTSSPFVVTYLQRKSVDDISHADLLWRYYSQSGRFYEAAHVQFLLARSAFMLPLARRIEYLGHARANASAFTHGVGRQARQKLLQEISGLIDVANIQDDILERIKVDTRLPDDVKADVIKDVDGPILDMTVVSYSEGNHCQGDGASLIVHTAFQYLRRLGELLRYLLAGFPRRRLPQLGRHSSRLATYATGLAW